MKATQTKTERTINLTLNDVEYLALYTFLVANMTGPHHEISNGLLNCLEPPTLAPLAVEHPEPEYHEKGQPIAGFLEQTNKDNTLFNESPWVSPEDAEKSLQKDKMSPPVVLYEHGPEIDKALKRSEEVSKMYETVDEITPVPTKSQFNKLLKMSRKRRKMSKGEKKARRHLSQAQRQNAHPLPPEAVILNARMHLNAIPIYGHPAFGTATNRYFKGGALEAERALKLTKGAHNSIMHNLRGRQDTSAGFVWFWDKQACRDVMNKSELGLLVESAEND